MKILAFAASNSKNSINKQLVTHAVNFLKDHQTEIIDLNDFELPIYSIDRENDQGIPELAQKFFDKIEQADGLIISYAEHNGSYTAAFKNIFDWASRINSKLFSGKKMIILAASPGPGGAKNVLTTAANSAPHFGADLLGSLSVPSFKENFDSEQGILTNQELAQSLQYLLKRL